MTDSITRKCIRGNSLSGGWFIHRVHPILGWMCIHDPDIVPLNDLIRRLFDKCGNSTSGQPHNMHTQLHK